MATRNAATSDDCIILSTDSLFDLALNVTRELYDADLLNFPVTQHACIENMVRSDIESQMYSFGNVNATVDKRARSFANVALPVLKMVMLRSAGVSDSATFKDYLPTFNKVTLCNLKKMSYETSDPKHSVLVHDKAIASKYYNCFDQIYPPSKIKNQLLTPKKCDTRVKVNPSGMVMLIFRNNFTQVINFSVTFTVDSEKLFNAENYNGQWEKPQSRVHIVCSVKTIKNNNHYSLNVLRVLQNKDGLCLLQTLGKHEEEWWDPSLHQQRDQTQDTDTDTDTDTDRDRDRDRDSNSDSDSDSDTDTDTDRDRDRDRDRDSDSDSDTDRDRDRDSDSNSDSDPASAQYEAV